MMAIMGTPKPGQKIRKKKSVQFWPVSILASDSCYWLPAVKLLLFSIHPIFDVHSDAFIVV